MRRRRGDEVALLLLSQVRPGECGPAVKWDARAASQVTSPPTTPPRKSQTHVLDRVVGPRAKQRRESQPTDRSGQRAAQGRNDMVGWMMTTLVFLGSITVCVELAGAHGTAPKASVISETMDSLADADMGSQADGDDAELEGTLEILHEDREDGSDLYHHFLSTRRRKAVVTRRGAAPRPPDRRLGCESGASGPARSSSSGRKTHGGQLQVLQYAPLSNTFGPQKVVVLLVNFSNDPSRPFTVGAMRHCDDVTDGFYRANSYGQTSLSVDVFGWYTLPMTNAGCPYTTIKAKADQAATAAGVNLSAYARRVYFFPYARRAGSPGRPTVGGNPSPRGSMGSTSLGRSSMNSDTTSGSITHTPCRVVPHPWPELHDLRVRR